MEPMRQDFSFVLLLMSEFLAIDNSSPEAPGSLESSTCTHNRDQQFNPMVQAAQAIWEKELNFCGTSLGP